ncbi:hypothetical protein SS1G_12033 [Sclerotinia sclerotiorum 1980 UF-70]|uniref:Uncharacterized protein n=1 Tax=Sclerotinia sclerotiorum (strain ATCC 18683 / 1980 / Ss-1) TaxID=665079 RepID=A7F437_SCLS1|nr:hypothetical protein SS1G_12033 [Sclerotinia sclerotiorum 1980 UF-70]EDN97508.1 hypothetical protein SS1G_12033 [Sclerotinia sclerotiorum 1980 UF-70]
MVHLKGAIPYPLEHRHGLSPLANRAEFLMALCGVRVTLMKSKELKVLPKRKPNVLLIMHNDLIHWFVLLSGMTLRTSRPNYVNAQENPTTRCRILRPSYTRTVLNPVRVAWEHPNSMLGFEGKPAKEISEDFRLAPEP